MKKCYLLYYEIKTVILYKVKRYKFTEKTTCRKEDALMKYTTVRQRKMLPTVPVYLWDSTAFSISNDCTACYTAH